MVRILDSKPKLGPSIGERWLVFRAAPWKKLVVRLGKPRKKKGQKDWECPFRIKGPGVDRFEFGYGVDALQALTTDLEGIRVTLSEIGKPLAWSGVLPDHTGFQRMIPMLPGISERLERSLDRELNRELRRLERRQKKRVSKAGASTARTRLARLSDRDRRVRIRPKRH